MVPTKSSLDLSINFQDKYIAYLDVLGFSALVNSNRIAPLEQYFEKINEVISKLKEEKAEIESIIISDSVILIAPDSLESLRRLFGAVRRIQSALLWRKVVLRGAIAFGQVHYDKEKNILVGKGYIRAYLLEKDAIYPRVIIDPQIIKRLAADRVAFLEIFDSNPSTYQFERRVIYSRSEFSEIPDDGIFIEYGCKVIRKTEIGQSIKKIYEMIVENLYSDHSLYNKYTWLKNYFVECMEITIANLAPNDAESKQHIINVIRWKNKFKRL